MVYGKARGKILTPRELQAKSSRIWTSTPNFLEREEAHRHCHSEREAKSEVLTADLSKSPAPRPSQDEDERGHWAHLSQQFSVHTGLCLRNRNATAALTKVTRLCRNGTQQRVRSIRDLTWNTADIRLLFVVVRSLDAQHDHAAVRPCSNRLKTIIVISGDPHLVSIRKPMKHKNHVTNAPNLNVPKLLGFTQSRFAMRIYGKSNNAQGTCCVLPLACKLLAACRVLCDTRRAQHQAHGNQ